jgi:hypothetical protein
METISPIKNKNKNKNKWYFEYNDNNNNYIIIKNDSTHEMIQLTYENPTITNYKKNKMYIVESEDKRKIYRIVREYNIVEYSEVDTTYYRKQLPKKIINKLIMILEGTFNVVKKQEF